MNTFAYEVHHPELLTLRAAALLASITTMAMGARNVAHVAFSGGATPRALFKLLATSEWQSRIPWARTHIWWVDERCVPPGDPESNFGMAQALLLRHLPVMITHRIRGEEHPWQAAYLYERELVTGFNLWAGALPRFDLIFLGVGPDGHIASLFPGSAAVAEQKHRVTVDNAPAPPHARVSLTLPVINHARNIIFMATGANKGPIIKQLFYTDSDLPAARVRPTHGHLLWLLDEALQKAASLPLLHQCQ